MNVIKGTYNAVEGFGEKAFYAILNKLTGDGGALQAMVTTLNNLIEESKKLGKATQLKYFNGYNILQDIMMTHCPHLVFGQSTSKPILSPEQEIELDQIAADCNFYCRFAAGAYGDQINYVFSGKNVLKALDPNDRNDEFVKLARIDPCQLVYSDWEADALNPAHCIVVLKERREVLLVIRGTAQAGDVVTDLVATYISYSVMVDEKGGKYLRINSGDPRVKDEINNLNISKVVNSDKNSKDKELFSGKAHSGIFLAGIELYKKIRGKLEGVFLKLPKGYRLTITGHSLGGGMTSVMTFLFLIHPLKYFGNDDLKGRLHGYTYGAPPIFNQAAAPVFEGHLFNVVNHHDLVPRLSFGSLKDLDFSIVEFHKNKSDELLENQIINFNQKKKKYELSETDRNLLEHYTEFYSYLKEKVLVNEKMYHLGRTFVMEKLTAEKTIVSTFKEVKGEEFLSDLIIGIYSPIYHFPHLYKEGLSNTLKFQ